MSELRTGSFIHVEDTTAGKRRGKYALVIDPIRRIFFFINTRKKKGKYKSYPHYDKVWDCFNILKKKYQFLRYPRHCISCLKHYFYDDCDPDTGKVQNRITEKLECSLNLLDLIKLKRFFEKTDYNKEYKEIILDSLEGGIWQAIDELTLTMDRRMAVRDNYAVTRDAHANFLREYVFSNYLPSGKWR